MRGLEPGQTLPNYFEVSNNDEAAIRVVTRLHTIL